MQLAVGVLLALAVAGSTVLVIRGLVSVARRGWKASLQILGGAVSLAVTVVVLGASAYALGPPRLPDDAVDPAQKARALGESISDLMNLSAWGFPLGVVVGVVPVLRSRASGGKRV
jgi:hypothetical protein